METIETSIGILVDQQDLTREQYRQQPTTQDVVERRFVKMTEAAIDIGEELVKHERGTPTKSNPATMRALTDPGVLTDDSAEQMAQAARFRNVLSHTYGDVVDHDVVYDALNDLERYRTFVRAVYDHLDGIGALDESPGRSEP